MSDYLLIAGGHVVDPDSGIDADADVLVKDGYIHRVGPILRSSAPEKCSLVDVAGMIVVPGLIDLHCHLRDPGFEEKETIETGTRAAARGGFTTVCCMPNTKPRVDSPHTVRYVREKAGREAAVRVLPVGCITAGQGGTELTDMESLAEAGVVGFSDDGRPVISLQLMRRAMECAGRLGLPIFNHCEDLSISNDGVMNEGALAAQLGLRGIPPAAEEMGVSRDIELSCLTGAHLHIAHISTAGSVALLRQARRNSPISGEVTPHHLVLTEERVDGYDTSAKVNPPLRTRRDVEALLEGLSEGVIEVVATDHAPHTTADKAADFNSAAFGISGFETALAVLLALVNDRRLTMAALIERLTVGPARILSAGIDRRGLRGGLIPDGLGALRPGAPGDVCVFDPGSEWTVDTSLFASKGKNNPWAGVRLKGKVMLTVVGGRIVYRDGRIKAAVVADGEIREVNRG